MHLFGQILKKSLKIDYLNPYLLLILLKYELWYEKSKLFEL